MITLQTLSWSDCFSYGHNNFLYLDKDPIVQLVGKNGHGKSSIGLILEEVCYNKNSKGTKRADVLNRYSTASKYSIELSFNKDGDTYKIDTTRGTSSTIKFTKNGTDISAHTATGTLKLIEEVLGLDSTSFAQLIYQSSASSLEFLTATDTNRKKFLINLLNLEEYTVAHDIFKGLVKDVSAVVSTLEVKIDTVSSWIENNKKLNLDKLEVVDIPEIDRPDTTAESSKIAELSSALKTIEVTNKRINQNNEYKLLQSKIPLEEITDKAILQDISAETKEAIEVNRTIRDAEAFIKKMGHVSDICPTCSQTVDNSKSKEMVFEHQLLATTAEERAKELYAIIDAAETNNKWVQKVLKYKTDYESYNALIDPTMTEVLEDKNDISQRIVALEGELEKANAYIKEQVATQTLLQAKNNKALAHNAKVDVISEQMVEYIATLKEHTIKLDSVAKELAILQLLQKTFSTNGLVAYKIECMVKDLQNLTNQYLGELSDGRFQISFQISSSDKLNVVIVDNGIEIDILALSSGERARVNTATLLAIRKLMQTLSSVRINILILDETIDNLDIDGKEKLVEVLLKEEHLNTILVSHGYSHPLIEKISVIKENNISRIE